MPPRRAWGVGRGLCRCVEMPPYPCVVKSLYRCRCQDAYRRGCASPGGVQPIAQRRRGVDERSRGKTTPDRREKALTSAGSLCLWGVATKASPIFLGVGAERRLQAAGRLSATVCALMSAMGVGISTCRCIVMSPCRGGCARGLSRFCRSPAEGADVLTKSRVEVGDKVKGRQGVAR